MSFISKAFTAAAIAGAVLAAPLAASAASASALMFGAAATTDRPAADQAAAPGVDAHDLFGSLDTGLEPSRARPADRFAAAPLRTSVAIDGVDYAALGAPGVTTSAAATMPGRVTSRLPEPATWAMMMLGFGGAGALMRRHGRGGGHRYRLVEMLPGGDERSEEFGAPDDATALARATLVAEGRIEVYRGDMRVLPQG